MSQAPNIDGVLNIWGDRLFYPGSRVSSAVLEMPWVCVVLVRQTANVTLIGLLPVCDW